MDWILIIIIGIGLIFIEKGINRIYSKLEELLDFLREKLGETGDEFNARMEAEWTEEQKTKNKK